MKIKNPVARLSQFWGKVDRKQVLSFLPFVQGPRVLDIGCGYGSTLGLLHERLSGLRSLGIDLDPDCIAEARRLFPQPEFRGMRCEELSAESEGFNTIILRDALHHLVGEGDWPKIKTVLPSIAAKGARLVIYDPNVNLLLRTLRFFSAHKDQECNFERALALVGEMGFAQIHTEFNTVISLPLSGGYVGINLVPNTNGLQQFVLWMDRVCERIIHSLGLGRHLCLRYLIVAEKRG